MKTEVNTEVIVPRRYNLILFLSHLSDERLVLPLRVEGRTSAEQDVEDDSQRPHVHLEPVASVAPDPTEEDLRCEVLWRAAKRFEVGVHVQELGQAEISNLYHRVGVVSGAQQNAKQREIVMTMYKC